MAITKEELLRVNKGFGGNLRSGSSLDFAFDIINNEKIGLYRKLAYLLRAILVDHPFSDGNKRTAAFVVYAFLNENEREVIDNDLLIHHLVSIAKTNETNIENIVYRLKTLIR